jgi:hypothetical protein
MTFLKSQNDDLKTDVVSFKSINYEKDTNDPIIVARPGIVTETF